MSRRPAIALLLVLLGLGLAVSVPRPREPRSGPPPAAPVTRTFTLDRGARPLAAGAHPPLAASGRHGVPRTLPPAADHRQTGPLRDGWRDFDALAEPPGEPLARRLADLAMPLRTGRAAPAAAATVAAPAARDVPWSPDRLLADATQMNDQHLALVVHPATGNLFAVFEAYDLGGSDRDIHVARSTDQGATWQTWEMPSFSLDEAMPDLAIDAAGYLHVVWVRDDGVVLRARSAGPGDPQNWAFVRGLDVGEPVVTPSVAVQGTGDFATVFIACGWITINWDWLQYESTLLWMWSTNGGQTASYNYLLPDGYADHWPDVAFTAGGVAMVNGETDPYSGRVRILAARDAVSGTFADYVDLSQTTDMSCGFPSVAADGANVFMVYQLDWDDGLGNIDGDVMYCYSWDGLGTVEGPYAMMATTSESVGPVVYARAGLVGCVWLEAPPNGDEFELAARQAGLDGHPDFWSDPETVTDQPRVEPRFRSAAGAVGLAGLHAAWIDRRDFPTQGLNVYTSDRGREADLEPYAPAGWESPLVVSMVPGARENGLLAAGHPAYVSIGVVNLGLAPAAGPVLFELRLDGEVISSWQVDGDLEVATYATVEDWQVDLPAGAHTLTLWIDPHDAVPESDEDDNLLDLDVWVMTGEPELDLSETSLRFDVESPVPPAVPQERVATAERLGPRLAAAVAAAAADRELRVVVVPADRVDAEALTAELDRLAPGARRRAAIDALTDRTRNWSDALTATVAGFRAGGDISHWRPLWLSGEIAAVATPAGVAALAAVPTVGRLWLDDRLNGPFVTPGAGRTEWHQTALGADVAWARGFDGAGILVGHTDTGVAWDHPDLAGRLWDGGAEFPHHGWDCLDEDADPYDEDLQLWHGTHTAGLVVGAATGAAPGATLLVTRCVPGYYEDLVEALQFCLDHGCRLITTSAGWTQPGPDLRAANRANAEIMLAMGVPWFVAAGNGDNYGGHLPVPDDISSPGDCPDPWYGDGGHSAVIAVGALTPALQPWSSSSRGPVGWDLADLGFDDYPYPPGLIKPDVAAPGDAIVSTVGYGGYASYSGTSMATPLAAACGAILLQASPYLTPAELAETLQMTAQDLGTPGRDNETGAGLIDLPAALDGMPDSHAQAFWVRNRGLVPLIVDSVTWDAPWLTLAPVAGVVQPGDSLRFTAAADATAASDGLHTTVIVLGSNDPASPATLPVTLAVGDVTATGPDDVPAPAAGRVTCRPNPFNPRTTVTFGLAAAGPVRLQIYDARGRAVRRLVDGPRDAGRHAVVWDGRDDAGRDCASGVYLLRLVRDGAAVAAGKAVLVR